MAELKREFKLLARPDVPFGYKFMGGNVGVSGKKVTLPHYMAMFLLSI